MNVAFFGGSFSPPHVGHVLAATYALSVGFDRVLAVVVKAHAFGKALAPFEQRAHMTELAFALLPQVEVSRIEATLPAPNYTLRTLQAVLAAHPDWKLHLLVGSDVMQDAPRWHAFDEVIRLAPLFVLDRAGQAGSRAPLLPEVSSSQIRAHLATPTEAGERWLQRHVPASVLAYIHAAGLFR